MAINIGQNIPPVPTTVDPLLRPVEKNENKNGKSDKPVGSNKFTIPWLQWFQQVRDKVNLLNESIVNLAGLVGTGILVKNGSAWLLRSIVGTAGNIDVQNGDGVGGNPTVNLIATGVTPGTYGDATHVPVLDIDEMGRITDASEVVISGGGGGDGGEILVADGLSAPPVMLTNEAEDDFLYSD